MSTAVSLQALRYRWPGSSRPTVAVDDLSLPQGESLFVQGPSGSGKSTLLNLLAGVLVPTEGEVQMLEQPISQWSGRRRDRFRADHLGYIFQQFNLLPYLTVLANVELPARLSTRRHEQTLAQQNSLTAAAEHWLRRLQLPESLWRAPVSRLSVGQQQRVAAARALMGSPELIIADEPTSALDEDNVENFMQVLTEQCRSIGASLIFVSHDRRLAQWFDHQLVLTAHTEEADA
ncbi:ABC transporter ATP-binding protein [Saccharospirillum mangrovi]|uniref:ABC transporter ATP-binding protein n=1 Tax=Saccharospirillum mangrovi TaxID=2161747 RepID=UPI000D339653|nr:ABC transporter ATP-binding protein [Saccharospirillum mangrovi]